MTDRTAIAALLAVATLLAIQPAAAGPADAKSWFVSGQLGMNYYLGSGSPEDSPSSGLDLSFTPRVLYFPVKSIGVGGELGLNMYSASGYSSTGIAIGPRAAYYHKMDASRYPRGCGFTPLFGSGTFWMPFAGVTLQYLMNRSGSATTSGYRGRIGVGAAPMIGDRGTTFIELGFQTQSLERHTSNQIYVEAGFGSFLFR